MLPSFEQEEREHRTALQLLDACRNQRNALVMLVREMLPLVDPSHADVRARAELATRPSAATAPPARSDRLPAPAS